MDNTDTAVLLDPPVPARRVNFLMLLFVFFLMLTAVCLHALRDGGPQPAAPSVAGVEYAATR